MATEIVYTYDGTREISFDGEEWLIPVKDKNGNETTLSMNKEDMDTFLMKGEMILSTNCGGKIH